MDRLDHLTATAILGIDTLWGGDVMNPSGTGRFIADSWFSDEPLPEAYTHPAAKRVREGGGVGAKTPDRVPTTTVAVPARILRHCSARSASRRSKSRSPGIPALTLCCRWWR